MAAISPCKRCGSMPPISGVGVLIAIDLRVFLAFACAAINLIGVFTRPQNGMRNSFFRCDVLKIKKKRGPDDEKVRKYIVITCRVHPGETNSSWVLKVRMRF